MTRALPFLDITAPGFSTRGPEVYAARARHWCARTPLGLAVLRHREAGMILRDRRFRQGSHAWPRIIGLQGSFAAFWQRSVISQEGAGHKATRALAQQALSEDAIAALAPGFAQSAAQLTRDVTAVPSCEFVSAFSAPFAGQAIALLLGEPVAQADAIARDATALGLAMALDGKNHEAVFNAACDRLQARAARLLDQARAQPDPARYVDRLIAAPEVSRFDDQALRDLIVITIFGGVDTTRAQLGIALALFADHPEQWAALRADPDLVPQAIEEVIRTRPTTTWSTREATEDVVLDDVTITAGETVHIFAYATGTDPMVQPEWRFDITARRKPHFGFGGGAHHCLGHLVARTDMACALHALVARVTRVEWAGTPTWLPESGNTGPIALPLRLVPG